MSTKTIWLVSGETGEYSDRVEWQVMAYTTEAEANKHRDAAQAAINGKVKWHDAENPFDPQCQTDYTGTTYSVSMIEVREQFQP